MTDKRIAEKTEEPESAGDEEVGEISKRLIERNRKAYAKLCEDKE